jgi:hypothetical protein
MLIHIIKLNYFQSNIYTLILFDFFAKIGFPDHCGGGGAGGREGHGEVGGQALDRSVVIAVFGKHPRFDSTL